jgi:hypothetical protein
MIILAFKFDNIKFQNVNMRKTFIKYQRVINYMKFKPVILIRY